MWGSGGKAEFGNVFKALEESFIHRQCAPVRTKLHVTMAHVTPISNKCVKAIQAQAYMHTAESGVGREEIER